MAILDLARRLALWQQPSFGKDGSLFPRCSVELVVASLQPGQYNTLGHHKAGELSPAPLFQGRRSFSMPPKLLSLELQDTRTNLEER